MSLLNSRLPQSEQLSPMILISTEHDILEEDKKENTNCSIIPLSVPTLNIPIYLRKSNVFTPLPLSIKQELFYTPCSVTTKTTFSQFWTGPNSLPINESTAIDENQPQIQPQHKNDNHLCGRKYSGNIKDCECLRRITLILKKYQKFVRKTKGLRKHSTNNDSTEYFDDSNRSYFEQQAQTFAQYNNPYLTDDTQEYSETDGSDSESETKSEYIFEEYCEETQMNLAIYQQIVYGNHSLMNKIKQNSEIFKLINKELGKNYSDFRLLEDYQHLLNTHKLEYENICEYISDELIFNLKLGQATAHEKQLKIYYSYCTLDNYQTNDILAEKLLEEILLHFGGIFDVKYFYKKYTVLDVIGIGIEGKVYRIKEKKNDLYLAAKFINYNELTMNNYRAMSELKIIRNFVMYLDRDKNELIFISKLWNYDLYDFLNLKSNGNDQWLITSFSEMEIHKILTKYILPLLQTLHTNNYIHGDIKPNNFVIDIKIKPEANEYEIGFIDFGTCLKIDENTGFVTSTKMVGSVGYFAPEVVRQSFVGNLEINSKIDIFMLALTLLYLLTHSHPFLYSDISMMSNCKGTKIMEAYLAKMQYSHAFIHLLSKMLRFEVKERYNIDQIFNHEWIKNPLQTNEEFHSCLEHPKLKLLFLDVDGVLTNIKNRYSVIGKLVLKLQKIIDRSDCKIVLSTSWRRVPDLKKKLFQSLASVGDINLENVYIGDTPCNGKNPTRVHEILQYLESLEEEEYVVYSWCAVDDLDLRTENPEFEVECTQKLIGHFVLTDPEYGMTDLNVQEILSILNRVDP